MNFEGVAINGIGYTSEPANTTATFTDCSFNDTGDNNTRKAAIETGDDCSCHSHGIP